MEKESVGVQPIRIGISIGDINGIGPEVIIKALSDPRMLINCTPIIYASNKILAYHKKLLPSIEFTYQSCKNAQDALTGKVNVLNLWEDEIVFSLGKSNRLGGTYAVQSLEAATQDLASGKIDVLVTAPFSKESTSLAGFKFVGHTEYLAHLSGENEPLMMMVAGDLRVGLVNTHIPLKDVVSDISKEKILHKIRQLDRSLQINFGIQRPKIAVLGLNPHAGENGKIGTEEKDFIIPAIRSANTQGIFAFGPYPADGFFGSEQIKQFDAILAMYHDQGLTGFKALAFEQGVNFTAGLPIVRTSPDHGTAFDIAGQNKASEVSMRNAIYLAIDIYRNNQKHKELTSATQPINTGKK